MGNRVTIDDIANKLNISRSLVSKALNDSYGVNLQTKTRIRYTALEMGYDFQRIKRNRSTQSGEIGVLVGDLNAHSAEDFYFKLLESLDLVCAERQVSISTHLIKNFSVDALKNASRSSLELRGYLLLRGDPHDAAVLASYGIPFAAVDHLEDSPQINRVGVDYYRGGRDAVEYLVEQGHSRIGFVGPVDCYNFRRIYEGFCIAMHRAHLTDFIRYCCTGPSESRNGVPVNEAELYAVLQSEERPTALLCASDTIAVRLYGICAEMGIRIPEDLSVIGVDNQAICNQLVPALTSVDYDMDQVARHAVNMLENAIRYPNASTCAITVDTRVIKRDSVRKLK